MSEAQFNKALEIVDSFPKDGPVKPDYTAKLEMYKYFKQATLGDVSVDRPTGLLDFEAKFKWDGWNSVKGTPKDVCYQKYVEILIKLLKASGHADAKKHLDELEAEPVDPKPVDVEGTEPVDPKPVDLEGTEPVDPKLEV